jgi:hypothetical protein
MPPAHRTSRSTPYRPAHARRALATATATAGVALTLVTVAGATAGIPVSSPVAASASFGLAVASTPMFLADAPALGAITTSTADAEDALDGARDALEDATTVMAQTAESGLSERIAEPTIDTTGLRATISDLAKAPVVPVLLFPELATDAEAQAQTVATQVVDLRTELEAARAQKAAEDAAAQAQRDAEAAAQAAAAALAAANTPEGAKTVARQMAADRYGWGGDQFSCLASLWQKESGWNYRAYNGSSGATGIPQALPGSKMASAGADWQTNAATQIAWGLDYIDRAYGSPCAAWGKSQASNWY